MHVSLLRATFRVHPIILYSIILVIYGEKQSKALIVKCSPASSRLLFPLYRVIKKDGLNFVHYIS
jgi:hypothetical protein